MRIVPALAFVPLLLCAVAPLQGQEKKPPKKGDTVIIRGCLKGSAVESADMMTADAEGTTRTEDAVPSLTYRLQGKKDLLKDLKDKHDRKVVEVKPKLRSHHPGSGIGTTVGRTRISIGVDPRSGGGSAAHGNDQAVPVIEAQSFEGTTITCGR
jgi:hypothetical protein